MIATTSIYFLAGAVLFALGLFGLFADRHLLRQILAVNIVGSGVFVILIAAANRTPDGVADPVPQAMVLTGVVVAISAVALALVLAVRLYQATGRAELPRDDGST